MKTSLFRGRPLCLLALIVFATPLFAARDFVATTDSATELALKWTRGENDRSYWITRVGPDGVGRDVTYTFNSSFADRALEPNTTYTYYVTATVGSGSNYEVFSATGTTAAWADQDIGSVAAAGSVKRTGDAFAVTGSGADIWGNADAFHFMHQPWSGDGSLMVRVDSLTNTAQWAKAGIMFRESLAPGARYVMAAVNPTGDGAILSRATT